MKDSGDVAKQVEELAALVLASPYLKRAEAWSDCFVGATPDQWDGNWIGVYILWKSDREYTEGKPPVYVGEGILGTRVWESFQKRKDWQFAQVLTHDLIGSESKECRWWRKLLERFLIVMLEPKDNID